MVVHSIEVSSIVDRAAESVQMVLFRSRSSRRIRPGIGYNNMCSNSSTSGQLLVMD